MKGAGNARKPRRLYEDETEVTFKDGQVRREGVIFMYIPAPVGSKREPRYIISVGHVDYDVPQSKISRQPRLTD